jgi:hypothetical protein
MAGLDRALRRVIKTHDLLPAEPSALDLIGAYQEIAFWIVTGAVDALKEAADVEGPVEAGRGTRPAEEGSHQARA